MEIKNDGMRTEIINKVDEVINKAIEDKNLTVLPSIFKELHLLYREYSNLQGEENKKILAEYHESNQSFTNNIQKKLISSKLYTLLSTAKDWRIFNSYLTLLK